MKAILALLFGFGLFKLAGPSHAKATGSGKERQVSVEGRPYTVFSLGEGFYSVTSNTDPNVWVEFNQSGETDKQGSEQALGVLRADMQQFPGDMFT